jgi:chromosome segregation ATPase
MFVKRSKHAKPPPPPSADASRTAESGPDPREQKIARLEQELAEERQTAAAARDALDAAQFKIDVLEKSYAKQLADARERLAATERELADKRSVLASLDGGHEEALRALTEARAELKLLTAERDQLRRQSAQGGFRQPDPAMTHGARGVLEPKPSDAGTINELIASAAWQTKTSAAVGAGHSSAQVSEHEAEQEEMLAPELVFTKRNEHETEEQ